MLTVQQDWSCARPQQLTRSDFHDASLSLTHAWCWFGGKEQGEIISARTGLKAGFWLEGGTRERSFPGLLSRPGNDRGTDRNRRVSSPLSPICSLFLAPTGRLSQKVQHLLSEEERAEGSSPPVVIKHRRPEPKHPAYGLPASE